MLCLSGNMLELLLNLRRGNARPVQLYWTYPPTHTIEPLRASVVLKYRLLVV